MLPQGMAPWYIKYFKLMMFKKQKQVGHFDLFPPFSPETGH